MFGAHYLDVGFYIGQIIAIAVGLWLALTFERVVSARLFGDELGDTRSGRVLRALVWLGLGYLLAMPFMQLLGIFHSLVRASLPQYASTTMSGSAWGVAPLWLWTLLNALAMLIVYAVFMAVTVPGLRSRIVALDPAEISQGLATVVLLAGANVAWSAVNMLSSYILRPEIPALQLSAPARGVVGFVGGWIIALLVVLTIGLYHNSRQSTLSVTDRAP